jgi:hypothetical protein
MLCPAIENPASCEIRGLNSFPCAKKMNAAEIHSELCAVYGRNVIREGYLRLW